MRTFTSLLVLSALTICFTAAFAMGAKPTKKEPFKKPDADMQKVLDEYMSLKGGSSIDTMTVEQARKSPTPTDAVKNVLRKSNKSAPSSNLAEVREIQVQGAEGMIPARVYIPKGKAPMPVVVYFHGGGFVIADNNVYDSTPRSLAEKTGAVFVSVEYRKGPEFKFPAAHDDAFAAYKWVLSNAGSFSGNPAKVAVAGESAGGNLALNVAIRARDEKVQAPASALLVYPVAGADMTRPSYEENAGAQPLNKPMMEWFVQHYLRNPDQAKDTRINLVAADLKSLPPTTIITAEIDPLQSEGAELAKKMKEAGNKVTYENYNGVAHEFFGMAAVVKDAKKAQDLATTQLKRTLW